ncbi:zinc finger protein 569-like isoform X2 [Portunus trituberculatus]|uniref:Zinc finger protein 180 n=1 Tax=Portunus trituberculatus TaxID=210409 RepID=A0A5B7F596_PORTR|nr:zinc finger protein 569-like isoform X2 [Portunus trituberculatus]XP_045126020.1 zinc finger protein 569-like isoform X2 [Portunus trituberculatus]MPC40687.1 Zinc finger protein 180 [Portunus trituberculatus]
MGAIHGKGRFQCSGCHQGFSWRLDLANHLQQCKAAFNRETKDQQAEYYLLETCFLCGCQLSGVHSEEASFVKGVQKLYHSKRPFTEVLEIITRDTALHSLDQHTIGLCKDCMNAVNKWDKLEQQVVSIAQSIRRSYRSKRKRKGEVKLVEKKVNIEGQEVDGSEGENEEYDEQSDQMVPENLDSLIKQENIMDFIEQDEKFQDCEDKEYKCNCGKSMKGLNVFVDHQLREGCKVRTNQHPCKFCGSVFSEKKLLIAHKKACTEASLINGAYECDICGRRFLVRGRVETHKRNVHSIGTADQQLCSYCGRTFGSGYNMKNHLAREHGIGHVETVMCDLCGKKFSDRSSLRNHMKNIHGERKYECETCGKKFAMPGMRNHHINEMHNNTYNYECNLCGEQFHVSFKYRYHMRKMHHTLQYACDDCGRTFIMRSDLYRHVRGVHLGVRDPKRYPCKVCGRLFPSKYKVKRHMSSHGIVHSKDDKTSEKHEGSGEAMIVAGPESSEAECSSSLTEVTTTSDGTSIDVHQLPVPDLYTGPHITTLTPEILQGEVTPDLVSSETMVVSPMSSLVVSAAPLGENITELHPSQDSEGSHSHQTDPSEHFTRDGSLVTQSTPSSSLIPVQQMIVIQDTVGVPSHAEFTLPTSSSQVITVPPSAAEVISVPPVSGQVLSIPQSSSQVISVPAVTTQVIGGTLHARQANFAVSLPQQRSHSDTSDHKLPTIHYQYFSS